MQKECEHDEELGSTSIRVGWFKCSRCSHV
jgi:hypothetical protein